MRILLFAAAACLAGGCSTGGSSLAGISETGTRAPGQRPDPPRETVRGQPTPVERWTREQRECEVGDRGQQRKCVMPHPGG